jgi:MarC family membrane protein
MGSIPLFDLFLILFVGMGPIKALLIFIDITQGVDKEIQRKVVRKAVTTAAAVAILLLIAGALFMKLLHFSTGALTIAGGLILLILALNIVLSPAAKADHDAPVDEEELLSQAIYPLGIPLILNPVGIVALTVLSAETTDLIRLGFIGLMVLLVAVIDMAILNSAHRLDKYLTSERILVLEKVLGIMLAALAVEMMVQGLAQLGIITLTGGH